LKFVFDGDSVKGTKVNTKSPTTIFFLDKQDWGGKKGYGLVASCHQTTSPQFVSQFSLFENGDINTDIQRLVRNWEGGVFSDLYDEKVVRMPVFGKVESICLRVSIFDE